MNTFFIKLNSVINSLIS